MFEKSVEVAEQVSLVYDHASKLERGQLLTHRAVTSILGVAPHEGSYDHVVRVVRRRMLNEDPRGIAMWPVTGVGYRLCTVEEQLEIPTRLARRGLRRFRWGRKSGEAIPVNDLTDHQHRIQSATAQRMKALEDAMRDEIGQQVREIRPTPVMPRRPYPVRAQG